MAPAIGMAHRRCKVNHGEYGLRQAPSEYTFSTTQVQWVIPHLIGIIFIIGILTQRGFLSNLCNICFPQLYWWVRINHFEAEGVSFMDTRTRFTWIQQAVRYSIIDWIVSERSRRHSLHRCWWLSMFWELWWRPFRTHRNHLGGCHILTTVADKLEFHSVHWWLVANCASCWIENGDTTGKHLEMAAVKMGNQTEAADDIEWYGSQMNSLW
jgi:hypothetical protein